MEKLLDVEAPVAESAYRIARVDQVEILQPLVHGISRRTRAFQAVWALVICLLVLHPGLALLIEQNDRLRDPPYGDKRAKLEKLIAQRPAGTPTVVMLGSSRTLLGFRADLAELQTQELTGQTIIAFNFGTPASGPITHLIYLKRLLADGIKPSVILLEVLPPALQDDPEFGPVESAFLTGDRLSRAERELAIRYGYDAHRTNKDARGNWANPWMAMRFRMLARVAASWVPEGQRCDWSRAADAHGWSTPPRQEITPDDRAEREAKIRADFAQPLQTLQARRRPFQALAELLQLCVDEAIPVHVLLMPEDPQFQSLYAPSVARDVVVSLSELCAERGVLFTNARDWLPATAFYDGHHMFRAGAEQFTTRLTRDVLVPELKRALERGPR
jgi:hypothetical protein